MTPDQASSSSYASVAEAPQAPAAAAPDDEPTFFAMGKDGCHAVKHENVAATDDVAPERHRHQMGIDGTCTTVKLTEGNEEQPTLSREQHKRDLPDRETYERGMDEALAEGRAKAAAQGEKAAAAAAEEEAATKKPESRWNGVEYAEILAQELVAAKQKVLEFWDLQKQTAIYRAHVRAEIAMGMSIKPPRPAIHWDMGKDEGAMPKGWLEDKARFNREAADYYHALRIEDAKLKETEMGMFVEREKERADALVKA